MRPPISKWNVDELLKATRQVGFRPRDVLKVIPSRTRLSIKMKLT